MFQDPLHGGVQLQAELHSEVHRVPGEPHLAGVRRPLPRGQGSFFLLKFTF